MKKFLCSLAFVLGLSANSYAVEIAGFEISPEIGFAGGSTKVGSVSEGVYGGFARVWLGVFNFVVAPQFKYDSHRFGGDGLGNTQYGASFGYNIDIMIAKLTPYVGVNRSDFDRTYKNTTSYNAGLKFKFKLIPISLGVLYTYQKPEINMIGSPSVEMQSIQGLIALHF